MVQLTRSQIRSLIDSFLQSANILFNLPFNSWSSMFLYRTQDCYRLTAVKHRFVKYSKRYSSTTVKYIFSRIKYTEFRMLALDSFCDAQVEVRIC